MNAETIVSEDELCSAGVAFCDAARNETTDTMEQLEYPEDTPDLVEVSNGSNYLCNKHQLTETQERSEDNWIDIDVIGRQNQEDNFVAVMVEAQKRTSARKIEEAEHNAAEMIKQLESMLKGACEERDEAKELCEQFKDVASKERQSHADQLSIAKAGHETVRYEAQDLVHRLQAEMDAQRLRHAEAIANAKLEYHESLASANRYREERKKHVRVCEDTRLVHEAYMDCTVRQHEQEKAVILEQLKNSSEIVETLEVKIQNHCQVIEELKEELIAQVNAATQRNADIESLTSGLASVQRAHDDIFLLWKNQIRKTEVEAKRVRRLTSELDFAASDKIMLEKKVSSVEDEFERAHAYYSDPANVRLPDDEIGEELADKTQSLCEDCVRLKWENTEHSMTIDGLEVELMAARTETWETRQEHLVEIGRLIDPSKHPLVVRVVAYTSDLRHGWHEVALIKMNPDTPFQSVLKSLRKSHPRKVLQVEVTGRFVFDSDTPTQVSHGNVWW